MTIRSWHLFLALFSVCGLAQSISTNQVNGQNINDDLDASTEAAVPAWEPLNPDLLTISTTETSQSNIAAMKALEVVCGHSEKCAPPQSSDENEAPDGNPSSVQ